MIWEQKNSESIAERRITSRKEGEGHCLPNMTRNRLLIILKFCPKLCEIPEYLPLCLHLHGF